jgi:hypothetical protein
VLSCMTCRPDREITAGLLSTTEMLTNGQQCRSVIFRLHSAREPSALGFGKQSNEINPTLGRVGCGPLTHATPRARSANAAGR